jgi:LmbE family N-acetylglucosaminyl deacetylase
MLLFAMSAGAQSTPVRVLLVTAHPDDDSDFSGSVYKITRVLGGTADLCVITNGEGGYRYSTLAEPIYGMKLTEEAMGREALPTIRKKEVMAGGALVGIRNFHFLDQFDKAYTQDVHEVLAHQWDSAYVTNRLRAILDQGHYDFVLVLAPTTTTHGAHQAAALTALAAISAMPAGARPTILAGRTFKKGETPPAFTGSDDYPVARVRVADPPVEFDRTLPFGFQDKLDYRIIGNWVIAEHKSQGLMQTLMNSVDVERYYFFAIDDDRGVERARALFAQLADRTLRP